MKNIISRYIEKIKKEHAVRRRVISVLLCLALVVSAGVFWNLRLTGVSMTTDVACNIEEHVHSESCNERTVICAMEESEEHTHADECYETMLICEKDEHAHTVSCLSDETADVEIASDWEESLPTVLNGNWAENVLSVAKSQLGYTESEKNFVIDEEDNSRKGYTRYGQWYGNLYADWNTMFMAFCLNYAEVPEEAVSRTAGCYSWVAELTEAGLYKDAIDYVAEVGDIVFFDTDEDEKADKVGVVSEVTETEIITVEGDYENSVAYVTYKTENNADAGIVGVLDLNDAYLVYSETKAEELAKGEESKEVAIIEEAIDSEFSDVVTEEPDEENFVSATEDVIPTEDVIITNTESLLVNDAKADEYIALNKTIASENNDLDVHFFELSTGYKSVLYFSGLVDINPAYIATGTTANGQYWTLDSDYVLTISGTGTVVMSQITSSFSDARNVTKIIFEEGITGISGFNGLSKLTEIVIASTVDSIGGTAFYSCGSLKKVTITGSDDTGLSIGYNAFRGCGFTELIIPNLASTGYECFRFSSLKRIVINGENISFGNDTFYGSTYLEEIIINANNSSISGSRNNTKLTDLTITGSENIIRDSAFEGCTSLINVNLNESITSILSEAFMNCDSLAEIIIPDSVTELRSSVFQDCDSLTNVKLSENITSIPAKAFMDCISLSEIEIPEKVTSIGSYAFSGCDSFTDISISDNITSIDSYAFYDCENLESIDLSDNITKIPDYAFAECSSLNSINIPEGVTSIGNYAFQNCTSLTEIVIPDSVTSFGSNPFAGCTSLSNIIIGENNTEFCVEDGVIFNKDKTQLIYYPPAKEDSSYAVPDTVTSIAAGAFKACYNLKELVIPSSVTTIGESAFNSCESLEKVVLGEKVTSIGNYSFQNCTSLKEVDFPSTLKTIGNYAFDNCDALVEITIPGSVTSFGQYAFIGCDGLNKVVLEEGITSIGNYAFQNCTSLRDVYLPTTLKNIGNHAFDNCDSIVEITIPGSVTTFGQYAFYGCGSLEKVVLSEGITGVGGYAFQNCTSLKDVYLATTLKTISSYAFYNCDALEEITIPGTVTTFGQYAFYGCGSLARVVLSEGITDIGKSVFERCSSLKDVKLPTTLKTIGSDAFSNCDSLVEIIIPESVGIINAYTFYGCDVLERVVLSEGITSIGNYAFRECVLLKDINLPTTLTTIGNYAFCRCDAFVEITIPDNVTSIGASAFSSCDSLEKVELGAGLTVVSKEAFAMCYSLKYIELPNNINNVIYGSFLSDDITFLYNLSSADSLESTRADVFNVIIGTDVDSLPVSFAEFLKGNEGISFAGPNILTIDEGAFDCDGVTAPIKDLVGEVYVDEIGAIYSLNNETKEAMLLYCPTVGESYTVPDTVIVNLGGESDGTYTLTGIGSHAFSMAEGLVSLDFESAENIKTLSDYAMADCLNLTSVNGENIRYNALMKFTNLENKGTNLFLNTLLLLGSDDKFTKENPSGSYEIVNEDTETKYPIISIKPSESHSSYWIDEDSDGNGYYSFLTEETLDCVVTLNPNGNNGYKYRIYIETTEEDALRTGFAIGVEQKFKVEDAVIEATCFETDIDGVVYIDVNVQTGETAVIPINIWYPKLESDGGGARIWAVYLTEEEAAKSTYVPPENSIQAWWGTKRSEYTLSKKEYVEYYKEDRPIVIGDGKGGAVIDNDLQYDITLTRTSSSKHANCNTSTDSFGCDHVEYIDFVDEMQLPDYCTWKSDIIEAINNGNITTGRTQYGGFVFKYNGTIFAEFYNYALYKNFCKVSDEKVYINDKGNLVFSFRIWSRYNTSDFIIYNSYSPITIQAHFPGNDFVVDLNKYDESKAFLNTAYETLHYMFSEPAELEASAEIKVPITSGDVTFIKSRTSGNVYGTGITYNLRVINNDVYEYDFKKEGAEKILITDELESWLHIKPVSMQSMFNNKEFGKRLTINITNATLCTDTAHLTKEVTDAYGNTAYITGENSNLSYSEENTINICWNADGDKLIVTVEDKEGNVSVYYTDSVEDTLNELGYIVIKEETKYNLTWDITDYNDGIIYGGATWVFPIYAYSKNTFQHGTGDDPTRYKESSKNIINNADLISNDIKSSTVTLNQSYEVSISKSMGVNGEIFTTNQSIIEGDILNYTVGLSRSINYTNLPIVDYLSGMQYLLVPVKENKEALTEKNLEIINIDSVPYYKLSKDGTYNNIFVGVDNSGTLLKANDITVDGNTTIIKWYFSSVNTNFNISYDAVVDLENAVPGEVYPIDNIVYANDREDNRIYATIPGYTVAFFRADKEIYDYDSKVSLGDFSMIGKGEDGTGETVIYRLSLETYKKEGDIISGNEIWDELPDTYGVFEWNQGVNVDLWFDDTCTGVSVNEDFGNWDIKKNESTGLYEIIWPGEAEIKFEAATRAYIYVKLKFPSGDYWPQYTSKVNGDILYNTFYARGWVCPVSHQLREVGQVYLQKGVYDVGTEYWYNMNAHDAHVYKGYSLIPNGSRMYYRNPNVQKSYVRFYVSLYNGGTTRMYLTDIIDKLPDGFNYRFLCNSSTFYYSVSSSSFTAQNSSYLTKYVDSEVVYKNIKVSSSKNDEDNSVTFKVSSNKKDGDLKYDSVKDMYYLDKGEAISFAYLCNVDRLKISDSLAENTVSMEYVDYMNAGVQVYDMNITTADNKCEDANDGDCRIVNGNTLESTVSLISGTITPGIKKTVESYYDPDKKETYRYNNYVPYNGVINWKIRAENNGYENLYDYTLIDTMDYPYTFVTGEDVKISLTIKDKDTNATLGTGSIPLNDDVRQEGGVDVTFKMIQPPVNGSYVDVVGGINGSTFYAQAHVAITTDPETKEETLTIDLNNVVTAIPSLAYLELGVSTENTTLEYSNKVYSNKVTLMPNKQEFNEVSSGFPNFDTEGGYESVTTYASVPVLYGYATASLKQVQELGIESDNIATSNGDPRYITLGDKTNEFRYTLQISAPDDVYMDKLVFIDSLPEIGDHSPYDTEVKRGSEFKVDFADELQPMVTIVRKDSSGAILSERVLTEDEYKVEFSEKTDDFVKSDRDGTPDETTWLDVHDPNSTRSLRIIIDNADKKIELGSIISVSFNAKVDLDTNPAMPEENAEPGEIAWNNFGYYYSVTIGTYTHELEALPLEVGVRIPSPPSLQKKLVYQEGVNEYVASEDLTFEYLVHEGTALDDYKNLTNESFADKQVTLVKLNVEEGKSISDKLRLEDVYCYELINGEWVQSENLFKWTAGAEYTIYELPDEDFRLRRLVGQKKNTYTFSYDPSVDRTFVCENSPVEWDIDLRKVDSADNSKVLSGAAFALYTKDASEGKIVPEDLATVLESTIEANGETWYFVGSGVTDEYGKLGFENLRSEVYYLYEYQAPDGYYAKARGQNIYYSDTIKSVNTVTAENVAGTSLPMTGGNGTGKLIAIGLTLMAASVVMLGLKKRKMKAHN